MPIAVSCPCGKRFQVKEEFAGKRGRCPACSKVILIPIPSTDGFEVVNDDFDYEIIEDPKPAPKPVAKPAPKVEVVDADEVEEVEDDVALALQADPQPKKSRFEDDTLPKKRKRPRPAKRERASSGSPGASWGPFASYGGIVGGSLTALACGTLFIAGLMATPEPRYYIFAPIGVVLGLITVFRCLSGQE